jgi:hypothetical protein
VFMGSTIDQGIKAILGKSSQENSGIPHFSQPIFAGLRQVAVIKYPRQGHVNLLSAEHRAETPCNSDAHHECR